MGEVTDRRAPRVWDLVDPAQRRLAAVASVAEGFCPVDGERLDPWTNCVGGPGGACRVCNIMWYLSGDFINFCTIDHAGLPPGHCVLEDRPE